MWRSPTLLTPAGCALALFLVACGDSGAPFNDAITEADLRSDLHFLASDEMRGRLVGTPEIALASGWIRDRFESLGLEPAGDDDSYFQEFDLAWFSLGEPNRLTIGGTGGSREPGDGWTPSNASGTGRADGEVVFAGFGIVEPRLDYDDYRGEHLDGKIVLVMEREPGVADPESRP